MKFSHFTIVLLLGITIGFIIQKSLQPAPFSSLPEDTVEATISDGNNPFTSISQQQYQFRLESEIDDLKQQINKLEKELKTLEQADGPNQAEVSKTSAAKEKLTKEILMEVGVNEVTAEDILNQLSQYEFQLLALHDQAKRDGYLNTPQYHKERRELINNAPSLQETIGKESYDLYLYKTEQNNRVVVSTVMKDSPAERLGVLKGDIILNYANETVLNWRELRKLTGEGVAGDYVNLTVLRNEKLLNILIPRGPLGVKLGATSIDPKAEYQY